MIILCYHLTGCPCSHRFLWNSLMASHCRGASQMWGLLLLMYWCASSGVSCLAFENKSHMERTVRRFQASRLSRVNLVLQCFVSSSQYSWWGHPCHTSQRVENVTPYICSCFNCHDFVPKMAIFISHYPKGMPTSSVWETDMYTSQGLYKLSLSKIINDLCYFCLLRIYHTTAMLLYAYSLC